MNANKILVPDWTDILYWICSPEHPDWYLLITEHWPRTTEPDMGDIPRGKTLEDALVDALHEDIARQKAAGKTGTLHLELRTVHRSVRVYNRTVQWDRKRKCPADNLTPFVRMKTRNVFEKHYAISMDTECDVVITPEQMDVLMANRDAMQAMMDAETNPKALAENIVNAVVPGRAVRLKDPAGSLS